MMKLQNIFNAFGLRSVENEQIFEDNAKNGDRSGLQNRKAISSKSK